MNLFMENETEGTFEFDPEAVARQVALQVLETEQCPYEVQINVLLTDNEGIHSYNKEYRGIDRETDVLSFPNLDFEAESDFGAVEENYADCFDPDSGELVLGDIIISVDKVREQAESYGHSEKREFAFLIVHSMLHLFGYDHMTPEDAAIMEPKQREILEAMNISREE